MMKPSHRLEKKNKAQKRQKLRQKQAISLADDGSEDVDAVSQMYNDAGNADISCQCCGWDDCTYGEIMFGINTLKALIEEQPDREDLKEMLAKDMKRAGLTK